MFLSPLPLPPPSSANVLTREIANKVSPTTCVTQRWCERACVRVVVEIGGIVVIINEPHVWPNSGTMIPSGSLVSLSVDCVSGFATQGVLKLDEGRTPCKYDETGVYNQETCLSHCKRTYVIKHCGCNPSFLFPLSTTSYLEDRRRLPRRRRQRRH